METKTTAAKMQELLKALKMNQSEFAELIGYKTQTSVSRLKHGDIEPGPKAKMIDLLYMVYQHYGEQFITAFRDGESSNLSVMRKEDVEVLFKRINELENNLNKSNNQINDLEHNLKQAYSRITELENGLNQAVNLVYRLRPLQTEANKLNYRALNDQAELFLRRYEARIEM